MKFNLFLVMNLLSKAARKGKKGEASMLKQTRLRKTGLVHFQGAFYK